MTAHINWPRPPVDGYTADDLDRLPDLPAHTELIDGSLVFVSPQKFFHTLAIRLLEYTLVAAAPAGLMVVREMTIRIGQRQRPEPDIIVLAESAVDLDATWAPAEAVVLAVEVISPESELRDRNRKPSLYASAGIPHFWLAEKDRENGQLIVTTHRFDAESSAYVTTGTHRDQLQVSEPFDIDISLRR